MLKRERLRKGTRPDSPVGVGLDDGTLSVEEIDLFKGKSLRLGN